MATQTLGRVPACQKYLPRIALLVAGMLCGCGQHNEGASPTDAIERAKACLASDPPDVPGALDFQLAAMRMAPDSPEVLASTIEFIRKTSQGSQDSRDAAREAFALANAAIPFQRLAEIPAARGELRQLEPLLLDDDVALPSRDISHLLKETEEPFLENLPLEVAALVLADWRQELDALALGKIAASHALTDLDWESWKQARTAIEAAERTLASRRFDELSGRLGTFHAQADGLFAECEAARGREINALGTKMISAIASGESLFSELAPFAASSIATSEAELAKLREELQRLERSREWLHNQFTLNTIEYAQQKKLPPKEALQRLAKCDEHRLAPYVYERYQAAWAVWFDELATEDEKVEAAKWRVTRSLVQE